KNLNTNSARESVLAPQPGKEVIRQKSPVTGRILVSLAARWLSVPGLRLLTRTTIMFAHLEPCTSCLYLAIANTVRMFGVAMVMMPVTTAALNQLPSHLIPHGTALNNTMRQIAASVGTAALVTIMASAARDPQTYGVSGLVHGANVAFF